jgi:hypothetical protein
MFQKGGRNDRKPRRAKDKVMALIGVLFGFYTSHIANRELTCRQEILDSNTFVASIPNKLQRFLNLRYWSMGGET